MHCWSWRHHRLLIKIEQVVSHPIRITLVRNIVNVFFYHLLRCFLLFNRFWLDTTFEQRDRIFLSRNSIFLLDVLQRHILLYLVQGGIVIGLPILMASFTCSCRGWPTKIGYTFRFQWSSGRTSHSSTCQALWT